MSLPPPLLFSWSPDRLEANFACPSQVQDYRATTTPHFCSAGDWLRICRKAFFTARLCPV